MNECLRALLTGALLQLLPTTAPLAAELEYRLDPIEVGPDCYALLGTDDYFSPENGGNIANTGFVVTADGVVVIDTGPSLRYGTAMREAIAKTAPGIAIERVVLTHGHPDHYLGNQAFLDAPIYGGSGTQALIDSSGEDFTVNMYRLVGDWMRGTESTPPTRTAEPGAFRVGEHSFELFVFAGHTGEDLALLDETCGVLYAGDLVFDRRTLSTPHADLDRWIAALEQLRALPFRTLLPGHGPPSEGSAAIDQTIDYLQWLQQHLQRAFRAGLDITEVMELPIPARFADFALGREEYRRSVHNLYPAIEASSLPLVNP